MMNLTLAPEKIIGERIEEGRIACGLTDEQLFTKANVKVATYYCYKRGEIPDGVRNVLELGIAVNLSPNRLTLENPGAEVDGPYDDEQAEHVQAIRELLARLTPDNPKLPLLARRCLEGIEGDLVQAGLREPEPEEELIAVERTVTNDGVQALEPLMKAPSTRRMNKGTAKVSEQPAPYGSKRKGKAKKTG